MYIELSNLATGCQMPEGSRILCPFTADQVQHPSRSRPNRILARLPGTCGATERATPIDVARFPGVAAVVGENRCGWSSVRIAFEPGTPNATPLIVPVGGQSYLNACLVFAFVVGRLSNYYGNDILQTR